MCLFNLHDLYNILYILIYLIYLIDYFYLFIIYLFIYLLGLAESILISLLAARRVLPAHTPRAAAAVLFAMYIISSKFNLN